MPKRTKSHIISDIALTKVQEILSSVGWASEVVHNDYGEDLLVQTHFSGKVDPNKLWIQVKGTTRVKNSITVSLEHALKWIRSTELVVVVLWDTKRNKGVWTMPKDSLKEWDIIQLNNAKAKLIFDSNHIFNKEAVLKIAWIARLDHYNFLVTKAINDDFLFNRNTLKNKKEINSYKSRVPLIAFDLLCMIGIINKDGIDIRFLNSAKKAKQFLKEKSPNDLDIDIRNMAGILAILIRIQEVTSCGVQESLLEACWDVIEIVLPRIDAKTGKILA